MPITNARQVVRMAELTGQPMPSAVTERLEAVTATTRGRARGGHGDRVRVVARLLDEGAPGIHFITMNRSSATLEVHENLAL